MADQIRDRLAKMGMAVGDQPDGEIRWHRQSINDSEPNYLADSELPVHPDSAHECKSS